MQKAWKAGPETEREQDQQGMRKKKKVIQSLCAEIDKGKSKGRSISFLVYHQKLIASQTKTQEELVLLMKKNIFFFFFIFRSLRTKLNLKFSFRRSSSPYPEPLGNPKVWNHNPIYISFPDRDFSTRTGRTKRSHKNFSTRLQTFQK